MTFNYHQTRQQPQWQDTTTTTTVTTTGTETMTTTTTTPTTTPTLFGDRRDEGREMRAGARDADALRAPGMFFFF